MMEEEIRVAGVIRESIVDGPGIRDVYKRQDLSLGCWIL